MDLSIIIVNFNTADCLESCLNSIFQGDMSGIEFEVIVVDNGSKDSSTAMVKNKFHQVRLIENNENLYFNKANNQGLRISKGRNLLILNPDTVIGDTTLKYMLSFLDNHSQVGMLTCKMMYPDGTVQSNCSKFPKYLNLVFSYTIVGSFFRPIRKKLMHNYFYGNWDRLSDKIVEVIPGSAMMINKEVLDHVGEFDENLLLYFSDDDLCERARSNGYLLMYLSGCTIIHHESQSVKKEKSKISLIYLEDLKTFSLKYYGTVLTLILKILLVITLAFRKVSYRFNVQ